MRSSETNLFLIQERWVLAKGCKLPGFRKWESKISWFHTRKWNSYERLNTPSDLPKNSSQCPVVTTTIKASFFFKILEKSIFHEYSLGFLHGGAGFLPSTVSLDAAGFSRFWWGFHWTSHGRGALKGFDSWVVLVDSHLWNSIWKSCFGKGNSCDVRQCWGMLHWRNMFARWSGTCLFSSYVDLTSISELGSNCPFAFNCAKKWYFNFLLW